MNYKIVLESFGLIDGVDFLVNSVSFDKLPKTRKVQSAIHHNEVPAVMNGETVIQPAVPAWDEPTLIDEVYYADFPSQTELEDRYKHMIVSGSDLALIISKLLEDKQNLVTNDDSLNLINNTIHTWNFKNIPVPTLEELYQACLLQNVEADKQAKVKLIKDLEDKITPRRIREALLTGDSSFIQNINSQIEAIRATL